MRTWVLRVIIGGFVVDLSKKSLDAPAHGVRVVYVDVVVFPIRRLLHERLADLLPFKKDSSCISIGSNAAAPPLPFAQLATDGVDCAAFLWYRKFNPGSEFNTEKLLFFFCVCLHRSLIKKGQNLMLCGYKDSPVHTVHGDVVFGLFKSGRVLPLRHSLTAHNYVLGNRDAALLQRDTCQLYEISCP